MSLELVVQVITAATLISGFAFGLIQVASYRRHRHREAALELVHSFQTPEFSEAIFTMMQIPDGLSKKELEAYFGGRIRLLYLLWSTWESIGILVYHREISLDLLDDFFSGPIIISWRKLSRYAADFRAETGRDTMGEWFQWLAERMMERESQTPAVPAHVQHRNWKPYEARIWS